MGSPDPPSPDPHPLSPIPPMRLAPWLAYFLFGIGVAGYRPIPVPAAETQAKAANSGPALRKTPDWQDAMLAARTAEASGEPRTDQHHRGISRSEVDRWYEIEKAYPVEADWPLQDLAAAGYKLSADPHAPDGYPTRWFGRQVDPDMERKLVARVLEELGPAGAAPGGQWEQLQRQPLGPHTRPWPDLYVRACQARRDLRLRQMGRRCRAMVFTKHYTMGGSHYAYTEGQSDAQSERHFVPGAALCLWEMSGTTPVVRTLIDDPRGVIRDPDVSYDGRRVLFAWKKSERQDDYHLYELELASGKVRQLTSGLGWADYEGGVPAQRRHHLQLHPLRADRRLLRDGSEQPVCLRPGRPLPAAAGLRPGTPTSPLSPRTGACSTPAGNTTTAGRFFPRGCSR